MNVVTCIMELPISIRLDLLGQHFPVVPHGANHGDHLLSQGYGGRQINHLYVSSIQSSPSLLLKQPQSAVLGVKDAVGCVTLLSRLTSKDFRAMNVGKLYIIQTFELYAILGWFVWVEASESNLITAEV